MDSSNTTVSQQDFLELAELAQLQDSSSESSLTSHASSSSREERPPVIFEEENAYNSPVSSSSDEEILNSPDVPVWTSANLPFYTRWTHRARDSSNKAFRSIAEYFTSYVHGETSYFSTGITLTFALAISILSGPQLLWVGLILPLFDSYPKVLMFTAAAFRGWYLKSVSSSLTALGVPPEIVNFIYEYIRCVGLRGTLFFITQLRLWRNTWTKSAVDRLIVITNMMTLIASYNPDPRFIVASKNLVAYYATLFNYMSHSEYSKGYTTDDSPTYVSGQSWTSKSKRHKRFAKRYVDGQSGSSPFFAILRSFGDSAPTAATIMALDKTARLASRSNSIVSLMFNTWRLTRIITDTFDRQNVNPMTAQLKSWSIEATSWIDSATKDMDILSSSQLEQHGNLLTTGLLLRNSAVLDKSITAHAVYPAFNTILIDLQKRLPDVESRMRGSASRARPVCICFTGTPGTGKSVVQSTIARLYIKTVMGEYADRFLFSVKPDDKGRIEHINGTHIAYIWDDMFQLRDTTARGPEATNFSQLASTDPFVAASAFLNAKGKTTAQPHIIVASTNYPFGSGGLGVADEFAIVRRFDMLINLEFTDSSFNWDQFTLKRRPSLEQIAAQCTFRVMSVRGVPPTSYSKISVRDLYRFMLDRRVLNVRSHASEPVFMAQDEAWLVDGQCNTSRTQNSIELLKSYLSSVRPLGRDRTRIAADFHSDESFRGFVQRFLLDDPDQFKPIFELGKTDKGMLRWLLRFHPVVCYTNSISISFPALDKAMRSRALSSSENGHNVVAHVTDLVCFPHTNVVPDLVLLSDPAAPVYLAYVISTFRHGEEILNYIARYSSDFAELVDSISYVQSSFYVDGQSGKKPKGKGKQKSAALFDDPFLAPDYKEPLLPWQKQIKDFVGETVNTVKTTASTGSTKIKSSFSIVENRFRKGIELVKFDVSKHVTTTLDDFKEVCTEMRQKLDNTLNSKDVEEIMVPTYNTVPIVPFTPYHSSLVSTTVDGKPVDCYVMKYKDGLVTRQAKVLGGPPIDSQDMTFGQLQTVYDVLHAMGNPVPIKHIVIPATTAGTLFSVFHYSSDFDRLGVFATTTLATPVLIQALWFLTGPFSLVLGGGWFAINIYYETFNLGKIESPRRKAIYALMCVVIIILACLLAWGASELRAKLNEHRFVTLKEEGAELSEIFADNPREFYQLKETFATVLDNVPLPFSEFKELIENLGTVMADWKDEKLLAAKAVFSRIANSVDDRTAIWLEGQAYFGRNTTMKKAKKVVGGNYSRDRQLNTVLSAALPNIGRIVIEHEDLFRSQGLFAIRENWAVTSYHFFYEVPDDAIITITFGKADFKTTMKDLTLRKFRHKDLCALRFTGVMFRDMSKHLPKLSDDLSVYKRAHLMRHFSNVAVLTHADIEYHDGVTTTREGDVDTAGYFVGDFNTEPGDCGYPYFHNDSSQPRRLIGFHYAGISGTDQSFFLTLYREEFDELVGEPGPDAGAYDLDDVNSTQLDLINDPLVVAGMMNDAPSGVMPLAFTTKKDSLYINKKSKIKPSIFQDAHVDLVAENLQANLHYGYGERPGAYFGTGVIAPLTGSLADSEPASARLPSVSSKKCLLPQKECPISLVGMKQLTASNTAMLTPLSTLPLPVLIGGENAPLAKLPMPPEEMNPTSPPHSSKFVNKSSLPTLSSPTSKEWEMLVKTSSTPSPRPSLANTE
jgi:hypothetical protein